MSEEDFNTKFEREVREKHPAVIVAAACKKGKTILVGARHFDRLMVNQIEAIRGDGDLGASFANAEQGFIDQHGDFHNRKEAYIIAERMGQLEGREKCDYEGSTTLYSEDLY